VRRTAWLLSSSLLLAAPGAAGAAAAPTEDTVNQAKTYFAAGAKAYALGDFPTAIRAFELAYELSPRAGILFSLGQAERRQYFIDRDLNHLQRAVAAFHKYLDGEEQGGRRAEAAEALSELEPLLQRRVPGAAGNAGAKSTRLMVTSPTEGALVSVDGAPGREAPFVDDVPVGNHKVVVSAPGYFEEPREVPMTAGAFVALDLKLREKPARLQLTATEGATVWLDGQSLGLAPLRGDVVLTPGLHRLGLQKRGTPGASEWLDLSRGATEARKVELASSPQRVTASIILAVGAVSVATGVVTTFMASGRDTSAVDLLNLRKSQPLTVDQLARYNALKTSRDNLIGVAVLSYLAGVILESTGALLWTFDNPPLPEPPPLPPDRSQGVQPGGRAVIEAAP
jgi:hypothetical protein